MPMHRNQSQPFIRGIDSRLTQIIVRCTIAASLVIGTGCERIMSRPGRALFDEAHHQKFLSNRADDLDLSGFAAMIRSRGLTVNANTTPLTPAILSEIDMLVISGPFLELDGAETDAVAGFVQDGGKLLVLLHIPGPAVQLLARLGVYTSNGVIREAEHLVGNDPNYFEVVDLDPSKRLAPFHANGAWALLPDGKHVAALASTGQRAWVDLDRDGLLSPSETVQSFAVAVAGRYGMGEFIVFGDDAVLQNRFLHEHNGPLAERLLDWCCPKKG